MPSSGDNSFPACFHKTNYADKCDRIWFNLSPNPRRNHAARTHSAICNVAGKILKPWHDSQEWYFGYTVKCLFLNNFIGSNKIKGLDCYNDRYGNYNLLQTAKDACKADANCFYVYDIKCDNVRNEGSDEGSFYLCPRNATLKISGPEHNDCVYAKEGNLILWYYLYFGLIFYYQLIISLLQSTSF